jgi:hypothetical protein
MKKITYFMLVSVVFFSAYCSEEKWQGKIYKEQGVIIVENEGPGLWERAPTKQIKFEEDLIIGEEAGKDYLMFRNKLDVTVDSEGNIYILDIGNQRILKFNEKGEFIWETGRKGQGPGEFQSRPSQYTYSIQLTPSEDIAVQDDRRIHFFNESSDYEKTLKIDRRIWDFDFLPDGRLLISLSIANQIGNSAAFYSSDGNFLNEFPDEYIYGTIKGSMGIMCGARYIVRSDKVYVSLPGPYEIREYNLEGNPLRKIRRDLKLESPFVKTKEQGRSWQTSNVSGPCFISPDGMIVNFVTLVEEKGERKRMIRGRERTFPILEFHKFLDFFNIEGQFLGSYVLKERELRFIDDKGFFYFSELKPYPRVIRAKLK